VRARGEIFDRCEWFCFCDALAAFFSETFDEAKAAGDAVTK